MSTYSSIPVRANGQEINASWFNTLRSALLSGAGIETVGKTNFTIANNQTAAANVTGLLFSSTNTQLAKIQYTIDRSDATPTTAFQIGELAVYHDGSAWTLVLLDQAGDDAGVTFSVTSGGQVQYTSTNFSGGSYSGSMAFKTISVLNA